MRPLEILRLAVLACLPLLSGCATPPPRVEVQTELGLVRGDREEATRDLAQQLERIGPRVQELLLDVREGPVEIWVQRVLRRTPRERSPEAVSAFTRFNGREPVRIYMREDPDLRWALAHELVHWYQGPSWEALPGVMGDGLADLVAELAVPEIGPRVRAVRLLNASLFFGGLQVLLVCDDPSGGPEPYEIDVWYSYSVDYSAPDPRVALAPDRWELNQELLYLPESLYGLGYVVTARIVARHGLAGLHELCLRARAEQHPVVPSDWLLEAGGLDDRDDWNLALAELCGREEVEIVDAMVPGLFGSLVAGALEPLFQDLDSSSILQKARPRLRLSDGQEVDLAELESVQQFFLNP